ncbi:MAG TPA: hypothetical protein VFZ53_08755 [Polyangiaceae bacterium]
MQKSLVRLERAARKAERRARLGAALASGAKVVPIALAFAALALAAVKLRPSLVTERALVAIAVLGVAAVVAAALRAAFRRRAPFAGAIALDRHHATGGRVANALAFSRVPEGERSALMQLAIDDAVSAVPELAPRRAVPISVPREAALVAVLALGVVALALFEVRVVRIVPPPPAPPPPLMTSDDVELFRDVGEELAKASQGPAQREAVARYNRLIEDIAARRVDRHEVFRRLGEIERDLGRDLEADREALDDGLDQLARELAKSGLSRKAAEALAEKRLDDAEKALRELAEKLRDKKAAPTRAELDRLRQALEKASTESTRRMEALEARRRELKAERESLLKKKSEKGDAAAPDVDRKLEENQRQLERLEREGNKAKRAAEKMSELDKELAKAAQDLQKELGDAAKDLDQGAENINRMAKRELDDEQKREMIRRLRELREVLRQESQGGESRKERLQRFSERARGGQKPGGQGKGQGKDGQGDGKPGGKGGKDVRLSLGRGDTQVEVPGMGQGQGSGEGQEGDGSPGGNERGSQWGTGHDPNVQGDATKLAGKTQDVSAAGIDTGEGTASAEVIYGAAERGFRSKGYRDVFTEYETVAEQVFEKDDIPPGYRFYVRRYFQLIRPRE